jgi:sec-independent protein translocase protein TatC
VPLVWGFFLSFEHESGIMHVHAQARLADYLGSLYTLLGFGLGSGFVVWACCLWVQLANIHPQSLGYYRRYAILACILGGAMMSPPDVLSQLTCAFGCWVLYECVVVYACCTQARA